MIELKASRGHTPGVVAVLEDFTCPEPLALVGRGVRIRTPGGRVVDARVAEARDHGPTISLFLRDLTRADVPVGSLVEIDG